MSAIDRPRVAFVTTVDRSVLHDDVDLPMQEAAFAAAGIDLTHAAWEDETIRWGAFDLVIVRSAWNYVDRLPEFLAWLEARRGSNTFHNPVGLIEWNLDKRHLAELADRGVAVVPTRYATSGVELRESLAAITSEQAIVKPSISAGSRLTGRFRSGSAAAIELGERILDAGFAVMVQPFVASVEAEGEIGTVCFDGSISHSFRKGPLLADDGALRGGEYREEISPASLGDAQRRLVLEVQAAVHDIARRRGWLAPDTRLLYARYDLVTLDDGSPALLEAELFEPCFFLPVDDAAPGRFIEAVRSVMSRWTGTAGW